MAITAEVQSWLDELKKTGAVDDESWKVLTAVAEKPQVGDYIKGSVLRQSDYSRQMNEIAKAKKDVEDKATSLAKFQADLATWQSGAKESFQKASARAETAERQYAEAVARLNKLGTDYGIPEDELKLTSPAPKPAEAKPSLEGNYLTREQVEEVLKKATVQSGLLDATIHDLSVRHQELFGKPLPSAGTFYQEALQAGKPLTEYFNQKFNVSAREAEISEQKVKERIAAAVKERETQLLSENVITPQARPGQSSVLFSDKFNPKLPAEDHANRQTGLSAAVAAYQTGKYRPN